ncbi:growth hormone-regulated TBC protein 1-A-like [Homarus americanus]|uniref:growth hormone-regulated TBC protein 1-A-like n=1 Tax=Homarus americanus TaxID=6706 RepID=UPI001C4403E4|nr:growth hormone-regulated TBC protein 1-A-like [Homarus americanus]
MAASSESSNSRISDVDEYGFERPPDFNYQTYEEFMSRYLTVLTRRAARWSHLLGARETVGRGMKVKRYVRKGIPMKHRGKMWMEVSGAKKKMTSRPGYYQSLLEMPRDEELVEAIRIDVPRTFPDNIYFRDYKEGKLTSLYNVLVAFSQHNKKIGYCQGINYIVGLLLIVTKEEESTFWLLNTLMEDLLPEYYTPDMVGVLTDIKVLEAIVKEQAPLIWRHIKHYELTWGLLTTKWFICLFAEVLPIETVLRIWDCLFYEGNKVLMRVAVTLVLSNQQKILMSQEFGEIIECFKAITNDTNAIDCHAFMQNVFTVSGSFPRVRLAKLRQDCRAEVEAEVKKK